MPLSNESDLRLQRVEQIVSSAGVVQAIDLLKREIKSDPHFYQGWLRLSRILFETENFREAVQIGQSAERFDPLQSEFLSIQQHMKNGALDQAEREARRMLLIQPGHPRAIFTIAETSKLKNYPEGAVEVLREGLEIGPANLFLRNLYVDALDQIGDFEAAIDQARTLVRTEESFNTLWILVSILLRHGQNIELLAVCDRAARYATGDTTKMSAVELVRGQILRVLGRREESVAAYRACLSHNPQNAGAWWALADMKTFDFSQSDAAAMRTLIDAPSLPASEKCVATFAFAKASEPNQDWDETMSLYHKANALHPNAKYDTRVFNQEVDARIKAFYGAVLATQSDQPAAGPTPIFILGLPRSGSTLIEQVLASHSKIEGTIEQPTMPSVARKAHVQCTLEHHGGLYEKIGALTSSDLTNLGRDYISSGSLFRYAGTPYFTDKLPFNFRHIGLIHKILPQAVIIDARRNPLDCGFSLYKQHFPTGVEFSYGLDHIGAFYTDYLRLMDHWHAVLPGRILTVQYEHLVRDPEPAIRAILDHVGVAFEPACLDFHKTQRAVRTASSEQVRQPINARGIGTWRKVERHLEPLKTALGSATLGRFDGLYDA